MKKSILIVSASPSDQETLRVYREAQEIENALGEKYSVHHVSAARPADIVQAILRYKPQFLHISGHGVDGKIALETEEGKTQVIDLAALASLLSQFEMEGLLINACYSAKTNGLDKIADWLVAMTREISDKGAIAFSTGFYLALEAEQGVESAFAAGKTMLGMVSMKEIDTPVLRKH